jgi:anti-sigma B factor antagonist
MKLTLQSHETDGVLVIRCKGRISFGEEVEALEAEVHKHTRIPGTDILIIKQVVIQLAETDYVDSSGLGALIRLVGVLRAAGGGLKLCELSPAVAKVIKLTNLEILFHPYTTEAHAIAAFSSGHRTAGESFGSSRTRIVCVDPSSNLLASLYALLTRSGYEVFTSPRPGDAATLVRAVAPALLICGPGIMDLPRGPAMIQQFRQNGRLKILQLPADFHTAEAGQAAQDLVAQVNSIIAA